MPLLSIAHLMTPASREDTDVLRRVQANLDRNLHPAVKKMRQEDAMRDAAEKERLLRNIQLTVCLEANSPIDKVSDDIHLPCRHAVLIHCPVTGLSAPG